MEFFLGAQFALVEILGRHVMKSSCAELCLSLGLVLAHLFGVCALASLLRVMLFRPSRHPSYPPATNDGAASWPIRALATATDLVVSLTGPTIIVSSTVSMMRWHDANGFQGSWSGPYYSTDALLWFTLGLLLWAGSAVWWAFAVNRAQTPGKSCFGVRTVRADTGTPTHWGKMVLRESVKWIPLWFLPVWYGATWLFFGIPSVQDVVDYWDAGGLVNTVFPLTVVVLFVVTAFVLFPLDNFWTLWDSDKQTLHDKVMRTRIVAARRRKRGRGE